MRGIGRVLRYLLNINTVWGLMILISFVLCVVQHYLPTTTVIPADTLHPGGNKLSIRIGSSNDKVRSFDCQLTLNAQDLLLPADAGSRHKDQPRLISAQPTAAGYAIKWDDDGYGRYEVSLNGTVVGRGKLVTLQALTDAAFDYAQKGFDMALGLVAAMVLFLGLMKVGEDAGIVQLVARVFHPLIRYLFPEIPKEHPANGAILMNVTTSILGLGNAATPFGIKAMQELETLNPHPGIATNAQVMVLAYNTAGFALLPTTLLAIRKSAGCSDPFEIIGPCMITGAVSTVLAIILSRLLSRVPAFSVQAALAETEAERIAANNAPDSDSVRVRSESEGSSTDSECLAAGEEAKS